jgi:hypothetical protein
MGEVALGWAKYRVCSKPAENRCPWAALIPGLDVKVEGRYNDKSQVVADSVSFKENDLKQAESIQAGLHENRAQAQQNKAEIGEAEC